MRGRNSARIFRSQALEIGEALRDSRPYKKDERELIFRHRRFYLRSALLTLDHLRLTENNVAFPAARSTLPFQ